MLPANDKFMALREVTATVDSIPMVAGSTMAKRLSGAIDALVVDVKVGSGSVVKRQVDARRLAQYMVAVGRRLNKRVQALLTNMNQPLGYAIGNALEVMEVSQTLQNVGPTDLTRLSLELAARMIYLSGITATMEEAREMAQSKLLDGSGYKKLKEVIEAQGGNPHVLDRFDLLPNATGAREITSPRAGYVSAVHAEDIGRAAGMIGGSRLSKGAGIDPAVGVILEVKIGQKVDEGAVLCRLYYTREDGLDDAAQAVEDAFRISTQRPEERELILEVVG
jgi:thymidine phosphorylase